MTVKSLKIKKNIIKYYTTIIKINFKIINKARLNYILMLKSK